MNIKRIKNFLGASALALGSFFMPAYAAGDQTPIQDTGINVQCEIADFSYHNKPTQEELEALKKLLPDVDLSDVDSFTVNLQGEGVHTLTEIVDAANSGKPLKAAITLGEDIAGSSIIEYKKKGVTAYNPGGQITGTYIIEVNNQKLPYVYRLSNLCEPKRNIPGELDELKQVTDELINKVTEYEKRTGEKLSELELAIRDNTLQISSNGKVTSELGVKVDSLNASITDLYELVLKIYPTIMEQVNKNTTAIQNNKEAITNITTTVGDLDTRVTKLEERTQKPESDFTASASVYGAFGSNSTSGSASGFGFGADVSGKFTYGKFSLEAGLDYSSLNLSNNEQEGRQSFTIVNVMPGYDFGNVGVSLGGVYLKTNETVSGEGFEATFNGSGFGIGAKISYNGERINASVSGGATLFGDGHENLRYYEVSTGNNTQFGAMFFGADLSVPITDNFALVAKANYVNTSITPEGSLKKTRNTSHYSLGVGAKFVLNDKGDNQ